MQTDKSRAVAHYEALANEAQFATPLLVVKTANGFALLPYRGELPQVALAELMCFSVLEINYCYPRQAALIPAIVEHFETKPEPTMKEVA